MTAGPVAANGSHYAGGVSALWPALALILQSGRRLNLSFGTNLQPVQPAEFYSTGDILDTAGIPSGMIDAQVRRGHCRGLVQIGGVAGTGIVLVLVCGQSQAVTGSLKGGCYERKCFTAFYY